MQIGVANAAVQDVDENVLRAKIAPFEIECCKARSSAPCGVAFNGNHDFNTSRSRKIGSKYFVDAMMRNSFK
jgi:hypothetical protein